MLRWTLHHSKSKGEEMKQRIFRLNIIARNVTIQNIMKDEKSKSLKELEEKLSKQRKQVSENLIKKKLDKKSLDYDTVSMILRVFEKSKFEWKEEHFENFDSESEKFRGKELPKNNRECVMLGVRLGTMRGKIIYNLQNMQLTEKHRQDIDDLIWNFVWYSWREARIIHDHIIKEKANVVN